tara:strand:- start:90 stop:764 length:675 start_codon:yes stop_codon:yes gene_type:complete
MFKLIIIINIMAIKKLVEVWDGKKLIEENIVFLKKNTKEVYLPISSKDKIILDDLLDTYQRIPCAGIAANQIGYNKRIFIGMKEDEEDTEERYKELRKDDQIDDRQDQVNSNANNYEFYINPQIDQTYKKSLQEEEEGCLSIPEIRLIAERYDKIKVRYYDINGKKIQKTLKGFLSRLFQHELDHLNGTLMVENNKIKKVYRISDNKQVISLYSGLIKQLSEFS